MGNPRLPKGPKPHDVRARTVSFQLRLTGPEREALDRIAERAGISAAEVVRQLIRHEDELIRRMLG